MPRRQGRIFLWSVAAYGAATVVFGLSRSFWLTLAALAAVGLSDAVSTVIRQTLRQFITPDRLRGRMTSINMIFFMGGPQLGEVEAGLVAKWVGAPLSVTLGGLGCVLCAALVACGLPRDGAPRQIADDNVPFSLLGPSTTNPPSSAAGGSTHSSP